MAATERNRTGRETILKRRRQPLASLEELTEACLPTLAARLWATCSWPQPMGEGWLTRRPSGFALSANPGSPDYDSPSVSTISCWHEPC
jgi:hypothetical protein